MPIKMSGYDFKSFIGSKDPKYWPEGLYVEDELLLVNGIEKTLDLAGSSNDDDVIEILGGALAWDDFQRNRDNPPGSLVSLARRWLKDQTETRVVISVPNDRLKDLPAILAPIKASICK